MSFSSYLEYGYEKGGEIKWLANMRFDAYWGKAPPYAQARSRRGEAKGKVNFHNPRSSPLLENLPIKDVPIGESGWNFAYPD